MRELEELRANYLAAKRAWIDALAKGYNQKSIDALESAKVDAWAEYELAKEQDLESKNAKAIGFINRLEKL